MCHDARESDHSVKGIQIPKDDPLLGSYVTIKGHRIWMVAMASI